MNNKLEARPAYQYNCKAYWGEREPYSIFREYIEATSWKEALDEFNERFCQAYGDEKDAPDKITISNMHTRVMITITEDVEIKSTLWGAV